MSLAGDPTLGRTVPQGQRAGVALENHYREPLRSLSVRPGDRHAAADVAHDAYLRVLERSSQAQIEHSKALPYRTMLNLAVDGHRCSRVCRAEPLEVLDDEEGLASPSPRMVVDQGQCLNNLQRALTKLSAICRSSFLLHKPGNLPHSQIAEHLNTSRNLVEKHIVSVMKHCRVRMCEWEAG